MRVSILILALSFVSAAAPAPAQSVIDVGGEKTTPLPAPERSSTPLQAPADAAVLPQENPSAVPTGRFTFDHTDNGFLRLDRESGQVAFCSTQGRGWTCQAAAETSSAVESQLTRPQDDVAALRKMETDIAALQDGIASVKKLQTEIIRLRDEVSSLKTEIVALKEPPPPRPPADLTPPTEKDGDVTIKLPTREDMARAGALLHDTISDTWRRFVDMINSVQKDMMRKS